MAGYLYPLAEREQLWDSYHCRVDTWRGLPGRGAVEHATDHDRGPLDRPTGDPPPWEELHAKDLIIPEGTPVLAVADGRVSATGPSPRGGQVLYLRTNQHAFYYRHLARYAPDLDVGSWVQQGQLIGYSGVGVGIPHLHFAVTGDNAETVLCTILKAPLAGPVTSS